MLGRQTDGQLNSGSLRPAVDFSLADLLQRLACAGGIMCSNTAPDHRYQSNSMRVSMQAQGAAMLRSRTVEPFVGTLMSV